MKWKCPVCQKENEDSWKCTCGFDESRNYEKYRTIQYLSGEHIQGYIQQKGNKDNFYEMYRKNIPIEFLERAAKLGNIKAQYELGRLGYDGVIETDIEKILYWWNRALKEDTEDILKDKEYIKECIIKLQKRSSNEIIRFGKDKKEWIVLERIGNKAFILAKDIVARRVYHEELIDITWEKCSLRTWLNGKFLQENFLEEEKKKIEVIQVKNIGNLEYRTRGGKDTQDKVFCLSIEEVEKYFKEDEAKTTGSWWLRSAGFYPKFAACVNKYGRIYRDGRNVNHKTIGVRPAIWINLEI